MEVFPFGQPEGGVCQVAYIVADLHQAMAKFTRILHAGPWFWQSSENGNASYRGKPMRFRGKVAAGNMGHVMIELIQQTDDTPSPFTEVIAKRGYGLHHQAVMVKDFDARLHEYQAMGYEVAFDVGLRKPHRDIYVDTKGDLPFFVEITEANDAMVDTYTKTYQASVGWDGKDPIRPFSALK